MFKILVAEDDAELRQLFCRVLTRHGFQPIGAADGVEALQVLERDYIDLIVSDIMMPQLDGYEATRAIRALDRPDAAAIPIFAMTANAFTEDRRRAYESGMNEHLTKPLEPDTLLRTLAKYLQR